MAGFLFPVTALIFWSTLCSDFQSSENVDFFRRFAGVLKKSKDGRRMKSEDAYLSPGVPQSCRLQKCIAGGMVRANFDDSRQPKEQTALICALLSCHCRSSYSANCQGGSYFKQKMPTMLPTVPEERRSS